MSDNSIDIEGLLAFIDESRDSMQDIEGVFIELENDPSNQEIINRIFRPVHSLKGNSGFFGLMNINKFAHRLENLLDLIRNGDLIVNSVIVDILLKGVEILQEMLTRAQADPYDNVLREDEEEFLEVIESCKPEPVLGSIKSVIDLEGFLDEAVELGIRVNENSLFSTLLEQIEKTNQEIKRFLEQQKTALPPTDGFSADKTYFYKDEEYTDDVLPLGAVLIALTEKRITSENDIERFRKTLGTLKKVFGKKSDAVNGIDELDSLAGFLNDEMMLNNDHYVSSSTDLINKILALFEARDSATDGEVQKLGEILVAEKALTEKEVAVALGKQKKVGEILLQEGDITQEDLDRAVEIQSKQALKAQVQSRSAAMQTAKTIRIDQTKLDSFANNVGELFINIDGFTYLKKEMEEREVGFDIMAKFTNMVTAFDGHVEALHESVMDIRKVPVKSLFKRFPKVIRQLYTSLGKDIRFVMSGEDTVIDKDLLEKIENPLVHILRNSVDHGIEKPEERITEGKQAQGTLELTASADENYVFFRIVDDGGGIDPEKMRENAVKKKFLQENEAAELSEKELINLIFRPGFSTAKSVSDVSGRGVGMDVVISALKECKGKIDVDSAVGKGTTVNIRIPVSKTLVANDAMLVEVSGRIYAINSEDVSTTIEMKKDYTEILGEEKCIQYDNHIFKIIDVNDFFYNAPNVSKKDQQVLVLSMGHKVALLVDSVLNHQKIVVKDFRDGNYQRLNSIKGVKGYTVLGNEDIALIIDVKKLVEYA